mmetsp:Transcript_34294/g.47725  ORF Transcript_34294/g.47725 Transcript_34294/m.47725 type:complete len:114 (-) Transcript_34294:1431-1772(-)
MVGSVIGEVGSLPAIYKALKISFKIIRKNKVRQSKRNTKVNIIQVGELVLININSTSTLGVIMKIDYSSVFIYLNTPICSSLRTKVTVSKFIDQKWRIIIWGSLVNGLRIVPF